MSLNINAIETCTDIPECMATEEIRHATLEDDQIGVLSTYVMHGWPSTRAGVTKRKATILVLQR